MKALIPEFDFFENYSEALLITNNSGLPVFVNNTFRKLTGMDLQKIKASFPNGFSNPGKEMVFQKHDEKLSLKVSVSEMNFTDKSKGKVYTLKDVSELDRAWHQLRETESRLTGETDELLYVISHDMQGPMRTVISYFQLIEKSIEKGDTANIKEFIKFAKEGVVKMNALLEDLLQFSRFIRKETVFAKTDLNLVIESVMKSLSNRITESGALISSQKLPSVCCDRALIETLFKNLIDNALKFRTSDRKPEIKVSVEEKADEYLFSVSDNGLGIDTKFYNRIFVLFQRLHSGSEYPGTGIGLTVCKKIAERHHGEIWVGSRIGEGSVFYFTLKKNDDL